MSVTGKLARLDAQADGLRSELVRLRVELAEVRPDADATHVAQLVATNEQLRVAARRAEAIAAKAVKSLDELALSSHRDPLTGTPNRTLMLDRLETAIALARRQGTHIAVLFLDLDHFKSINDTLGHAVGDEVVQLVARRLESVLRESDTVSRHGGDEFLVLLPEVSRAADAGAIAATLLAAVAAPSRVHDHELQLSASLGIALYPDDGTDAATLISQADEAMYRSKRRQRGAFAFYGEARSGAVGAEPDLRDLRAATTPAPDLQIDAEEACRRQIKFLALVAHELRGPLDPVRSAPEVRDDERTDEPLLARMQVIIKRQVSHLSRVVEELLDRSEAYPGPLHLERLDLAEVLEQAVARCKPAMDTRRQHLRVQVPPRPLPVQGDPVRLEQVFNNLLDSASKYTPRGGAIAVTVSALDQTIAVTVSDNGIGISAAALRNIFAATVPDARAPLLQEPGLDIGLSVVRDLVEAHGGTVVGSSAGRDLGSEFVVTLPVADAASGSA